VGCQRHTPAALLLGKPRHPLYRRLEGPQGLSGRVRKISPPSGFDPRTVRPVATELSWRNLVLKEENSLIENVVWKEDRGIVRGVEEDASPQKRDAVLTGI